MGVGFVRTLTTGPCDFVAVQGCCPGRAGGADGGVPQHAQDGQALRRWREQPPPVRPFLHAGVADHHGGRGKLLPLPFAASDWVGMRLPPRCCSVPCWHDCVGRDLG